MKKKFAILSVIILSLCFAACKKDPTDIPIGTIKVDIDGKTKTFSVQAKASRLPVTGGYGIQIQGNYRTGSTTNLTLVIVRPSPITTGIYTENVNDNPLVTMTHCIEVITPCVFRSESFKSTSNPVSITISELTNSYVKGTFKGELQTSSNKENYTNGVFYVSF